MTSQIIIYLDGSVNVNGFKDLHPYCKFLLNPYDSPTQNRKDVKWEPAIPSEAKWCDLNEPWESIDFCYDEYSPSDKLSEIYSIIGKDPLQRRDGLHLDSAYKSDATLFLTSDKGDIWKNRHSLESLLGFKIFHPNTEIHLVRSFFEGIIAQRL